MRREPRAVIFDMDGTLVDSLPEIAAAVNRALEERGLPSHPLAAYRQFVGDGLTITIQRALGDEAKPAPEDLNAAVTSYYEEGLASRAQLYPGVTELLDRLVERGVLLAVCSNKPHWALTKMVGQLFHAWPWVASLGACEHWPIKPDPTAALLIAEQAGIQPADCLFLGDSGVDIETALRAGMVPAAALWGYRPEEELSAAGASIFLSKPLDLCQFFGSGQEPSLD